MLTAEGCLSRRQRLWSRIANDLDGLILADPMSLMHLANYYVDPFVFRAVGAGGILLIDADGRATIVTDSMVRRDAELSHVDEVKAPTWYDGVHSAPPRRLLLLENTLALLGERGGKRFGIEAGYVPAGLTEGIRALHPGAEFVSIDRVIRDLRRAKDPDEVALIKLSVKAMEAGFHAARTGVVPGMTELDAFHVIERASRDALGDQMPIYGDVNSGPNTLVGGFPTLRVIEKGDIFLLDYSVVVWQYRADFASAWVVRDFPSDQVRRMGEACVEALAAGEALLRPGTPAREIDRAVRASFARHGLAENFTSHSGHGLGLGHPDPPYLVAESDDVLVEGDVIAIEPSQRNAALGLVRCEHNYLITPGGYERLSHHDLSVSATPEWS